MSLEQHLTALLGQVRPLEPLDITLKESIGCQLVGDVRAGRPVPHFPMCAVAGYAVRSSDLAPSAALTVVDRVAPGFAASQPVQPGATVYVAKGTPLPAGADAVVAGPPARVGASVTVNGPVPPGHGVTAVGGVAAEGAVVLPGGLIVDPVAVGALAMLGELRVSVRPRPRVVVVSVGSELMPLGAPATAGLVYDAVGPMLAAAADDAGAEAFRVGPVPCEERPITDAIEDQLIRADLLLLAGPISAPGDLVPARLAALGSVSFDEGSTSLGPFGHGTVGDDRIPVLAIPSDPVTAAMLFAVLAVPMIDAMRGVQPPVPHPVRLGAQIERDPQVTQLILGTSDPSGSVLPIPTLDAGLAELLRADVLLRILPGTGMQPVGSAVPALPLRAAGPLPAGP